MGYRGTHRMPLSRRVRLWAYTFPTRDGVKVVANIVVSFTLTIALLWLLTGHI